MFPPRPSRGDASAKRVDGAYAMLKGGAQPAQDDDDLLQQLQSALDQASAVLAKLKGAEQQEAPAEDAGSQPPAGMP